MAVERAMAEGDCARQRLTALKPERRAALYDAARQAFIADGFEAASLNVILKTAGISKGQAYYYIKDKADLFAAVIAETLAVLGARLGSPLGDDFDGDAEAFWAALGAYMGRLSVTLTEAPDLATLGRRLYESPASLAAAAAPVAALHAAVAALLREGQACAAVRDDLPEDLLIATVLAAATAIDRWFAENWASLDAQEAFRLNRESLMMIRNLVAPGAKTLSGT
ncbi:TetR/AcrR family transcriptional regulator [Martelella alba]|uniref:TetR/AcrR family transcriptional regulator n=1 Tax=Martelella alba TaxID=2590451 RepID=A0A506UF48_9HYPH|nr:TetR/AcrR family transcriptional regulator [Martelella alba]TPW32126.1 TetR/AcrR family transcriptional regulator [Martelella alba]